MSNDKQLKNFLKKIENKVGQNEFVLLYIDKILWNFSMSEFFITENKMYVYDKNKNNLSIEIDCNSNVLITLNMNNISDKIEVTKDKTKIERSEIKENNDSKKITCVGLYFDENDCLKHSDVWETIIFDFELKTTKREQITVYSDENTYSVFNQDGIEMFCLLKKKNINLKDYNNYVVDDQGCVIAITNLIEDVERTNIKCINTIPKQEFKEKVKNLKI